MNYRTKVHQSLVLAAYMYHGASISKPHVYIFMIQKILIQGCGSLCSGVVHVLFRPHIPFYRLLY